MAAQSRHQGRVFLLFIGSSPLPWKCEITNGFSAQASEIDMTCKADAGVKFTVAGSIDASIEISWFVDYTTDAAAYTHTEAHADFLARTALDFLLSTGNVGDETIDGTASITAFNITASDEEGVGGTATLKVQGAYTLGVAA